MRTVLWILLVAGEVAGAARAEQSFPRPDWRDRPSPFADDYAEPGGKISINAGQYPKSFNYLLDHTVSSAEIFSLLYETLLGTDGLTLEEIPGLANRWTLSDDKLGFTFHIDPEARWSDGRPILADDVIWTYHAIMDPKNLTGPMKVGLSRLEPPTQIDERTVHFRAREVHWANLLYAGGFYILPRHAYQDMDFNRINFAFPVVSGPYRLGEVREPAYVRLEKRADYWAAKRPGSRYVYNFETIEHRFYTERDHAFDAFRKGDFDIFPVYTAHRWVNQTSGERFDRNWIVKQAVQNHAPQGFQGWAMNLRREPFNDRRVRLALAHLVNREKMNATHMYNQYRMHRSYYEDLYDRETPCPNPVIAYDPERARGLLAEAGWTADPGTGTLQKDGKPFVITFLTRDASSDKFLDLYREDLKNVGIELRIDRKDWAAWIRDMDEFNYDMTWAAWSASLQKDPEGMWHSKEADRPSGNNITGFRDARVDALIERQRGLFDIHQRHAIVREIDTILAGEVPYILLWYIDYSRLLYWNKFGMPEHVLSKYGNENAALAYWWSDPDALADLEAAQAAGTPLPPRPPRVVFDQVFREPIR